MASDQQLSSLLYWQQNFVPVKKIFNFFSYEYYIFKTLRIADPTTYLLSIAIHFQWVRAIARVRAIANVIIIIHIQY